MEKDNIATTVSSNGVAFADFDLAVFTVNIALVGETPAKAKAKINAAVKKLNTILDKFIIDADSKVASVDVTPNYVYDKSGNVKKEGSKSRYTTSFRITDMEAVTKLNDTLCSIEDEGFQISAPIFKCSSIDAVQKEALKNAVANANAKFSLECSMLGMFAPDFEIKKWQVHYDERLLARATKSAMRGTMVASAAACAPSAPAAEIESGQAQVSVTLQVSYGKRL